MHGPLKVGSAAFLLLVAQWRMERHGEVNR